MTRNTKTAKKKKISPENDTKKSGGRECAADPRALAVQSLLGIERDGRFSNIEIDSVIKNAGEMKAEDKALYTRLVYGVTETRLTLDYAISRFADRALTDIEPEVLTALRLGVYQLRFMDKIPEYSAVNESVKLVPSKSRGFVNAVLRAYQRAGGVFPMPEDRDKYLEVMYSVPAPLIAVYKKACRGDDAETEELLRALTCERMTGLRLNTLKNIGAREAALLLPDSIPSRIAPDIVLVPGVGEEVRRGLEEGLWFVQDEASRITARALGAEAGMLVIDTCACPGGKSFSAAMDMKNTGELYSFDLHKNKLSLIEKTASRLGITIIKTAARDARVPDESLIGRADRVLCDAPCSGLGVIAKKPEIRYKNPDDILRLPEIQRGVLEGASRYVKEGGLLVYSTCTLNPDENEAVVEDFLARHGEFALCPDADGLTGDGVRTFYPHRDFCDGFFAARMKRIK